jgi:hypothetical protein
MISSMNAIVAPIAMRQATVMPGDSEGDGLAAVGRQCPHEA